MKYTVDWLRYIGGLAVNAVVLFTIVPIFAAGYCAFRAFIDGLIEWRDQMKHELPRREK